MIENIIEYKEFSSTESDDIADLTSCMPECAQSYRIIVFISHQLLNGFGWAKVWMIAVNMQYWLILILPARFNTSAVMNLQNKLFRLLMWLVKHFITRHNVPHFLLLKKTLNLNGPVRVMDNVIQLVNSGFGHSESDWEVRCNKCKWWSIRLAIIIIITICWCCNQSFMSTTSYNMLWFHSIIIIGNI